MAQGSQKSLRLRVQGEDGACCVICLCDVQTGDAMCRLPCAHSYAPMRSTISAAKVGFHARAVGRLLISRRACKYAQRKVQLGGGPSEP